VRIDGLAKLLVEYSLGVKEGDVVIIRATTLAKPAVRACFREGLIKTTYEVG